MVEIAPEIIYWDTSGIISVLIVDQHTPTALQYFTGYKRHFLSSLAMAETCAVLGRIQRETGSDSNIAQESYGKLLKGPWHQVNILPDWNLFQKMATKWPLRGADLWHLSMAKTLAVTFPELKILTFDHKLTEAARQEGLLLSNS